MKADQFASDKILDHLDRVHEWAETGNTNPVTMEFDLTNRCPCRCPECFGYHPERDLSEWSSDRAHKFLDECAALGVRSILFSGGGEPTLHPSLSGLIESASEYGIDTALITCGLTLTPEVADVVAAHCTWCRVSIDAGSPAMYAKTHGVAAEQYDKAVYSVRLLARAKGKAGTSVTVGVGYLTGGDVPPSTDMVFATIAARAAGADYIQFRPYMQRHGQPRPEGHGDAMCEWIGYCEDIAAGGINVLCSQSKYEGIAAGETERPYGECHGHHFRTVAAADGKLYTCCYMRGVERMALGNLWENTLQEVWAGKQRREVYEAIDLSRCPLWCGCDGMNRELWRIAGKREHRNFL